MEALRKHALRAGIGVLEWLDLTPRETYMMLDAHLWREEQRRKEDEQRLEQELTLAWLIAALTRAKRLPPLRVLLTAAKPAKPLKGEELEQRRSEFMEMTANLDLEKIARKKKAKDGPGAGAVGPSIGRRETKER